MGNLPKAMKGTLIASWQHGPKPRKSHRPALNDIKGTGEDKAEISAR